MKAKHSTPGPQPNDSFEAHIPYLEPEPLTSEKEELLLAVVEQDLFAQLRQESTQAVEPGVRWNWTWMTGLSGAFAAAAFLLFVWAWPESTPTLQVNGMMAAHSQFPPRPSETIDLQTLPDKTGELKMPKRWNIQAAPNSSISLKKGNTRSVKMQLRKGFVQVAVVPKSMKNFEVQAGPIRTVVQGTIFTVERGVKWVRVEVRRGKVTVHGHGKQHSLTAGQGIRLSTEKKEEARSYKAPKQASLTLAQQLEWLKKHAPQELPHKAFDLVQSNRLSLKKRFRLLMGLSDFLGQKGMFPEQYRLLKNILDLPLQRYQHETTLFETGKACRKWKRNHTICMQHFKNLVRLYPSGANAGMARIYLQQSKSKP